MGRSNTPATILSQVNGIPARVGVIQSDDGSAQTNEDNDGTNFDLQPGGRYVIQCPETDIAITGSPLLLSETDITPVSADPDTDLVVPAGQPCMVCLRPGQSIISVAATDGSTAFHAKVMLL